MMSSIMKYYLIYYEENGKGELYAYTSSKKKAKEFIRYRKHMKLKSMDVGLAERKYLNDEMSSCRIQDYQFKFSKNLFSLLLTYNEVLYVESIQAKADISLTGTAVINPMIFKKKFMNELTLIRYSEFFMKYQLGIDVDLDEDRFFIFIKGFGYTLNIKKIENEVIN